MIRRLLAAMLLATLLVGTISPAAVHAAGPYVVNSTNDTDDADTTDGICQTATSGECTLRAALQQANADALSTNTDITFSIPGGGVHTITTTHLPAFPVVTVPTTINGTTQSGWVAATASTPATLVIEIDCRSSVAECFQLRGTTNVVKGLTINHAGTAITVGNSINTPLTTVVNTVITGNHLGTNPAGTAASPPLSTDPNVNVQGILIGNGTATVGGVTPADRNVIAGFKNYGVLTVPTTTSITVQGNYIGTDATGTTALSPFGPPPSGATGLIIQSPGLIGGPSAAARNIISGWGNRGVIIGSGNIGGPGLHTNVTVQGNYIGTDVTGTAKVPNLWGVAVTDADNVTVTGNVISGNKEVGVIAFASATANPTVKGNILGPQKDGVTAIPSSGQFVGVYVLKGKAQVGGTTPGDGNIIAFNDDPTGAAGVYVVAGNSGTTVLGNSIHANSLSLTGSGDGITLESGANNNQAAPTITSAATGSGTTTIVGTLTSTPSTSFRLEFFANTTTDAAGISEGETYAGTITVTTTAGGTAAINTMAISVPVGKYLTATATDTVAGNTSQFSGAVLVASAAPPPVASFTITGLPGTVASGSSQSLTVTARDAGNATITGYTGIVHFASSDPQATSGSGLPADYTFTPADAGVHTFPGVVLKTTGTQSVTVNDTVITAATGTASTFVTPAGGMTFAVIDFPSPTTAGAAQAFTVLVKDAGGNIATGYTGTVHFTSTDPLATSGSGLPADYTFTAADQGIHSFTATLKTVAAGTAAITATDGAITGSQSNITVNPGAATHYAVTGAATTQAGAGYNLTATARDAFENVATGYRGTASLTTTDLHLVGPTSHTFTAGDNGAFIYIIAFNTAGAQTVTAKDVANASITGALNLTVTGPGISSPTSLSALSPTTGPAAGGNTVTITGTSLTGATAVTFGGTAANPATIVVNGAGTSLTVAAPAHAAGTVDVVVTSPGGTATVTHAYTFLPAGGVAPVPPGGARPQPGAVGSPGPAPGSR